MNLYTIIYNARLIDGSMDCHGAVVIKDDQIHSIMCSEDESLAEAMREIGDKDLINSIKVDAKGLILMPAFIDMHVHFRYPGQSEKEDLLSGSRAAAAGGVGTVVLMPNTNPVVSSIEEAQAINSEVSKYGIVDSYQTVSITNHFDGKDISHLDACVKATKKAVESGNQIPVPVITEDGHDVADESIMRNAMAKCSSTGIIVSCHCEDPSLLPISNKLRKEKKFADAEIVLADAENRFTERNINLALETNCRVHIAHTSTEEALDLVRKAKSTPKGKDLVTCEVTPHHLYLDNEEYPNELVNPPLRSVNAKKAVINAILDGTVDVISTDHAPHTQKDKENGACGFTGLETSFAIVNTIFNSENKLLSLSGISKLMSQRPAELLSLKKGLLKSGYIADLILVDETKKWIVCAKEFQSKGKYTPLEGKELTGKVVRTMHCGKWVY